MANRGTRPDLDQGHGVRFERPIVRMVKALAARAGVTYSEMARRLVDEALYARLAQSRAESEMVREAVLHAIEYGWAAPPDSPALEEPPIDLNAEYIKMMQEAGEW